MSNNSASPRHRPARGLPTGGEIAGQAQKQRLTLVDLNPSSLAFAERSILQVNPDIAVQGVIADALAPLPEPLAGRKFTSISVFLLIHCLPYTPQRKNALFQVLRNHLSDDGVLFGSTVLGRIDSIDEGHTVGGGIHRDGEYKAEKLNLFGYLLMVLYNKVGLFHNWDDNQTSIKEGLEAQFDEVETWIVGRMLLFTASKPKRD
jgi:hypothetical protein